MKERRVYMDREGSPMAILHVTHFPEDRRLEVENVKANEGFTSFREALICVIDRGLGKR